MPEISAAQLGHQIAVLRERAGMKQAELARRVTWSQAVVSRVEAGDRPISDEELTALLLAIGTPEAQELEEITARRWTILPKPSLDHPDQDLLWQTERLAQELESAAAAPDIRLPFERRIREYVSELRRLAGLVLRREHQLAFMGPIGVGKSTAICKATGMEVKEPSGRLTPVLEAGAGGITLCEVHVRVGPGHGVVVEPRSDEEIRADVADFVDQLLRSTSDPVEADGRAVPHEVERAIRNMTRLRPTRSKDSDGKTVRRDPARELAIAMPSRRELIVEILARMELHRRDRRDAWFDPSIDESAMTWMRSIFADVNNGRHPEFSLPRRIELVVPRLLAVPRLTVSIIDTRGIDQPGPRADLEVHLSDRHTVAVLCSGFNDVPAGHVHTLLTRAREIGNNLIETNACLLALPRPAEALAVKDESGIQVATSVEGYELKAEQVGNKLGPLRLENIAIGFFNSLEDDPHELRAFLQDRVHAVRASFCKALDDVIEGGRALLANRELEQVQEVQRAAGRLVDTWILEHTTPVEVTELVHDSLLSQIASVHAATVHASVRRGGEWLYLSYSHELGHGARRVAITALGDHVKTFADFVGTLASSDQYEDAKELLAQAERLMDRAYDKLLRKVQVAGETMFSDDLREDGALWAACESEWGRGSGYRERVAGRNRKWFDDDGRAELRTRIQDVIAREWTLTLARVRSIFEADG